MMAHITVFFCFLGPSRSKKNTLQGFSLFVFQRKSHAWRPPIFGPLVALVKQLLFADKAGEGEGEGGVDGDDVLRVVGGPRDGRGSQGQHPHPQLTHPYHYTCVFVTLFFKEFKLGKDTNAVHNNTNMYVNVCKE